MDPVGSLTQNIHRIGCELTSVLQHRLLICTDFFVWISKVLDPRYAYLVFFPLMFHFNRSSGVRTLWTAAVVEWLNHVSKWLLFGERPYWWVHQHRDVWGNNTAPVIKQFSITCETGPGSPSGHVMIMGSVLYVLLYGLFDIRGIQRKSSIFLIGWIIYIMTMLLIATSRVAIAAHFPHQCVAGLIMGIILGYLSTNVKVSSLTLKWHLGTIFLMFFTTMISYYGLLAFDFDPNWTIPLAKKWCVHSEWVHLNTTPFYMFWRYTGTILGIAVVSSLNHLFHKYYQMPLSLVHKGLLTTSSVLIALLCSFAIPDSSSISVVYFCAFFVHAIVPIIIMGVLPWLLMNIFHPSSKDK